MKRLIKNINIEMVVELSVSVIIMVLFFFPWLKINVLFYSKDITALRMFTDLGDLLSFTNDQWVQYFLLAFYIIPLLALTNLVFFIVRDEGRLRKYFMSLCMVVIIELTILLVVCFLSYSYYTSFGIAFWFTLLLAMTGLIFVFICAWIEHVAPPDLSTNIYNIKCTKTKGQHSLF